MIIENTIERYIVISKKIQTGEIFIWNGIIAIKTQPGLYENHTDERNAIDLKTGESFFVSDDTLVEHIKKYKFVIGK